ncbi:MAG: DUF1998 domain-containing protein, partial [Armatimonadota bacterium]
MSGTTIGTQSGDTDAWKPWLDDQWIDSGPQTPNVPMRGAQPSAPFALTAGKTTEVLRIAPNSIPTGLDLDPQNKHSAVRGAIISAAFLLRRVFCDQLDIDPDEIEVARIARRPLNSVRGFAEIILNDTLVNGAGFVSEMGRKFDVLLRDTCLPNDPQSYAGNILSPQHQNVCDLACYDCLKVFRNMHYHGLLDWRLGVAYTRILLDSTYRAGLDGNFQQPELVGWDATTRSLRDEFITAFGYTAMDWGQLPGFVLPSGQQYAVVHPLWDTRTPDGIVLDAVLATG